MSDTTVKQTRTPRSADSITAGALKLPLAERVQLKKELEASIANEVNELIQAAKLAEQTAKS
jgi:hypothetical protein